MEKEKSKINIKEIFIKHKNTLRENPEDEKSKFNELDEKIFFKYPFIIALLCLIIIRIPDKDIINMFSVILSIFIGLFLNLLVVLLSVSDNKEITDSNEVDLDGKSKMSLKSKLVRDTFYNLSYTIVISFISLSFLLLLSLNFIPCIYKFDLNLCIEKFTIPYNLIHKCLFSYIFYYFFSKVVLTLLMILKRIFKLFQPKISQE